jgi:tetratricopeptide (TPR) repeat protein
VINDLLPLLAQGGVDDPTPEELADILWLAQQVLSPVRRPGSTTDPVGKTPPPSSAAEEPARHTPQVPEPRQEGEEFHTAEDTLGIHLPTGDRHQDTTGPTGTPVQVPAAASLPHALALTRALRPLTRKVPSRTAFELDEEATVARLVDEDLLLPVLRPEPTRWLSLGLVVDCGPSMALWQDEVHELEHELARLGAFRAMRRWNLVPSCDGTTVEVRPHPASDRPARHPREVVDAGSDQLILLLSDTVGAMWRTGAAHRLMADWVRRSQVALAHLLPAALWNRVGIAPAPTLMHIPQPGLPNAQWKAVRPDFPWAPPDRTGIPLPVIELEPRPVRVWAEMTAGNGRWATSAALLLPEHAVRERPRRPASAPAPVTAEETIRRFRASSSPQAWRLAGLLSAHSSVTIPLARLVQRALLRDTSRSDLAEVFFGGLLRQTGGPETATSRGPLRFEFPPEIQEALRGSQYRDDVEAVRELVRTQITAYLKPRYGTPRSSLGAVRGATAPGGAAVPVEGEAIATASPGDVVRMGASVESEAPASRVLVSYAGPDRAWAEWVGHRLEVAGYSVDLHGWHWPALDGFVEWADTVLERGNAVVALLSKAYLRSADWTERTTAGLAANARFVPLGIGPLTSKDVPMSVHTRLRRNLFGLDEPAAVTAVAEAVTVLAHLNRGPTRGGPAPQPPPRLPTARRMPQGRNAPPRNHDFVGREELLLRVREGFLRKGSVGIQTLNGITGVGKSQIALEYVHRFASQYDVVKWVDAHQLSSFEGELPGLRQLTVLDNADNSEVLGEWLPQVPGSHVLITSRNPAWRDVGPTITLDVFSRSDSRRYLSDRIPTLTDGQARTVAHALGDLPLALAQAAGVLNGDLSVANYLMSVAEEPALVLKHGDVPGYRGSLAAAVEDAANGLAADHPETAVLLRLGAYFGPDPIPLAWLSDLPGQLPSARHLTRLGLAGVDHEAFHIHRLTKAIIRGRTRPAQAAAARARVTDCLAAVHAGDPDDPASWTAWAALTSHLTGRPQPKNADQFRLHRVLVGSVRYLLRSGNAPEAQRLCTEFHKLWFSTFGATHRNTVNWAAHLAQATAAVGACSEAQRLHEDVLEQRRILLGDDHPDTLTTIHDLANVLLALGRHADARRLHEDVLQCRRRILGDDHPDTLTSVNNLANALRGLDQHVEALRLHRDALERRRITLGGDHLDTLTSSSTLANALRATGDLTAARRLHEDVLQRRRRILGEDHPATLASAHHLGVTLYQLGANKDAEAQLNDTLTRCRRVLGEEHPSTVSTKKALVSTLVAMGRRDKAVEALGPTASLWAGKRPLS